MLKNCENGSVFGNELPSLIDTCKKLRRHTLGANSIAKSRSHLGVRDVKDYRTIIERRFWRDHRVKLPRQPLRSSDLGRLDLDNLAFSRRGHLQYRTRTT